MVNMEIVRIDNYSDSRFSPEVLKQHGAFVVDGKYPCAFRITGTGCAEVEYHDYSAKAIMPIIGQFRFFAGHITKFYDKNGRVLAEYPRVKIFTLDIGRIQPSQFYVDQEKVDAVSDFIGCGADIIIPVMPRDGRYISLDGHTRLYYAYRKGWTTVSAYETEVNEVVLQFAEEAERRGVSGVGDMELLPHDEYEIKWNQFCDDFLTS